MPFHVEMLNSINSTADSALPTPMNVMMGFMRLFSPYQLNPFDLNPLRDVVRAQFDFERLRRECPLKLFIAATTVRTGKVKLFHTAELSESALLASACLPTLHHAVEIDGAHRPGHFDGVATVVARLFNQVLPDVAIFGRKDYQQLAVIRHMVRDLAFPIEILGADIKRETDGLAMSSRNQYLSDEERAIAPRIHQALLMMRDALQAGSPRVDVERDAAEALAKAGFVPDYAVIRTPGFAEPEDGEPGPRVALIAAKLGRTRLIDNVEFALD